MALICSNKQVLGKLVHTATWIEGDNPFASESYVPLEAPADTKYRTSISASSSM